MHAVQCEKVEYLGNYCREQLNFMFQHMIPSHVAHLLLGRLSPLGCTGELLEQKEKERDVWIYCLSWVALTRLELF